MTQRIRNTFKTIGYMCACAVAYLLQLARTPTPSHIILMYHSFDATGWKYGVRPKELERQIAYLVVRKRVVPFADAVAFVKGMVPHPNHPLAKGGEADATEAGLTSPRPCVAITVDDVYEDTYTVLFPLLKKYNIPATLFLTTDLSPQEKLGNLPRPTWEQLKEMQDSGLVTVEVHGRTHINWPTLETDEALADEILGARNDIEMHLGYRPRFAAYPAGRRDARVADYLKRSGFEAAVAITEGAVHAGDDLFTLKRVQVDRNMNFTLFRLRLDAQTLHSIRTLKHWGSW